MTVMEEARLPIPSVLIKNLENVINTDIRHFFENGNLYPSRLEKLAIDAIKWKVELDKTTISFAASSKMYMLMRSLRPENQDIKTMDLILRVFIVMQDLEIELDLRDFQNEYFLLGKKLLEDHSILNFKDQKSKMDWIRKYLQLGKFIKVKLPNKMEHIINN